MKRTPARPDAETNSALHRLERALHLPVGFVIVPIFGLANAGVRLIDRPAESLITPITLGVGLGLSVVKVVGIFGCSTLAIRLGLADMPIFAGRVQLAGTALLCGIGFTMSIFITLLAFPADPGAQALAKIGILAGSILSGLAGYTLLRLARSDWPPTSSR